MRYILKWWCWNKQCSLGFILKCCEFPLGWSIKPYVIKITPLSEYIRHWKLLIDHITSCSPLFSSFGLFLFLCLPSTLWKSHRFVLVNEMLYWFYFLSPSSFLCIFARYASSPFCTLVLFFHPSFQTHWVHFLFQHIFIQCLTIVLYLSFLSSLTLCNVFFSALSFFFPPFPHLLPFVVILLLLHVPSPSLSFSPPLL